MSTDTERAVIEAVQRMTNAFHQGDLEAVMAAYEPGAAVAFEPGRPVTDPTSLRQAFQQFFGLQPRFSYSGHEVILAGDTAVHFAPWTMHGTAPDGSAVHMQGLSVAVLRRQRDGRWLMVIDNPHGARLLSSAA